MAADITDKARKSYSFLQKTLNGGIDDNDTTITLNNVTNIPTDTAVTCVIDRVDSSGNKTPTLREIVTGIVSGSTLTQVVRGVDGTTAQAHSSGAVVEFVLAGDMWNDLIDLILTEHNQSGGHTAISLTSHIDVNDSSTAIRDTSDNELLKFEKTASAVNEVTVKNAATGNAPRMSASGGDTNVNLSLRGKGTGKPVVGAAEIPIYLFDFVASGCVWSGDSYGSTLAASMTSGVIVINGNPLTVAAVTARAFTASKDTYIDASDNGDGTVLLTYTEVTNNAASPALAANSVRIGIIVSGASNIAAVGSVNQGQENKVLPIASSIPYQVTDSLGNLICPRDPQRRTLGYRQRTSGVFTTTSGTNVQLTELSVPIIVPTGRKIRIIAYCPYITNSGAGQISYMNIWEGVVASGTMLTDSLTWAAAANYGTPATAVAEYTPASSSITINVGVHVTGGTGSYNAAATYPMFLKVELV